MQTDYPPVLILQLPTASLRSSRPPPHLILCHNKTCCALFARAATRHWLFYVVSCTASWTEWYLGYRARGRRQYKRVHRELKPSYRVHGQWGCEQDCVTDWDRQIIGLLLFLFFFYIHVIVEFHLSPSHSSPTAISESRPTIIRIYSQCREHVRKKDEYTTTTTANATTPSIINTSGGSKVFILCRVARRIEWKSGQKRRATDWCQAIRLCHLI